MFFTSWSYFIEFLLSYKLLSTVKKNQIIFWDMTGWNRPHRFLMFYDKKNYNIKSNLKLS